MEAERRNVLLASLGKKGRGKSAVLRRLAWECLRRIPSAIFLVHDPRRQWRTPAGIACRWKDVAECRAHAAKTKGLPRLNLFDDPDADQVCKLARDLKDCTVVLDELDAVTDGKKWTSDSASRIVHWGRHERVSLWGSFRRAANIPEDFLAMVDVVFLFGYPEAAVYDLRGLEQRLGPEYCEASKTLDPFQFVAWSDLT